MQTVFYMCEEIRQVQKQRKPMTTTQPIVRVDKIVIQWELDDTERPIQLYCVARAHVSYPINDQGDRRLVTFTSSGLSGIDRRSTWAYEREIECEQIDDLRAHLRVFGVEMGAYTNVEVRKA
jgi:hypothetical protein